MNGCYQFGAIFLIYYYFYPFLLAFDMLRHTVSRLGLTSGFPESAQSAVALVLMYIYSHVPNYVLNVIVFAQYCYSQPSMLHQHADIRVSPVPFRKFPESNSRSGK